MLKKISFECRTITPMFMSGADGKTFELRAPSIKGALRFWWRAMKGDKSLSDMRKEESLIFGGTGEYESKSKFNLRILNPPKQSIKTNLKDEVWDKSKNEVKEGCEGKAYLYYSTFMGKSKQYCENLDFTVQIASFDDKCLKEVANAFYLLSLFGGLGSRSRRTAGNFVIEKVEFQGINLENLVDDELKSIQFVGDSKEEIANTLSSLIKRFGIGKKSNQSYSNLSSCKIFILDGKSTPDECLQTVGKAFRDFRYKKNPDYNTVKQYLEKGSVSNSVEKAAFGLPLSYRYNSVKIRSTKRSALIEGDNRDRSRSASPLILSVLSATSRTGDLYFPILTVFDREFLPGTDKLKIRETTKSRNKEEQKEVKKYMQNQMKIDQPAADIISKFLDFLGDKVEVTI